MRAGQTTSDPDEPDAPSIIDVESELRRWLDFLADWEPEGGLSEHDEVARTVYRSLLLRQAQLRAVYDVTMQGSRHIGLHEPTDLFAKLVVPKTSPDSALPAGRQRLADSRGMGRVEALRVAGWAKNFTALRAYHLAVTDIFVEKAIEYLDGQAKSYRIQGSRANVATLGVLSLGVFVAFASLLHSLLAVPEGLEASVIVYRFLLGFTFYGMLVILAVGLRRLGRAMMDQAERLSERKHALRQGRLFVHLNDGILTVEEMDRVFNWNASAPNAFGNMPTEDQAPTGAALRELARYLPEATRRLRDLGRSRN